MYGALAPRTRRNSFHSYSQDKPKRTAALNCNRVESREPETQFNEYFLRSNEKVPFRDYNNIFPRHGQDSRRI